MWFLRSPRSLMENTVSRSLIPSGNFPVFLWPCRGTPGSIKGDQFGRFAHFFRSREFDFCFCELDLCWSPKFWSFWFCKIFRFFRVLPESLPSNFFLNPRLSWHFWGSFSFFSFFETFLCCYWVQNRARIFGFIMNNIIFKKFFSVFGFFEEFFSFPF